MYSYSELSLEDTVQSVICFNKTECTPCMKKVGAFYFLNESVIYIYRSVAV